jgi:hypothetical protein
MTGVVRDWRAALVEAYPDLFHPLADHPGVAEASPECGEGWRDLLERCCARIRAAVQADGGSFKATQIKEKYATLRFCCEVALSPEANAKVEEIIDLAGACSACTCELCGEQGWLYQSGCWMMARCALHAEGCAVGVEPTFENVHVKERIAGRRREIICRRYDRKTDSFIAIDPGSLGIEEE